MSSRAFRRLHGDVDVIRLRVSQDDGKESEENDVPVAAQTQRKGRKKGFVQPVLNPFDVVGIVLFFVCCCFLRGELSVVGIVAGWRRGRGV